MKSKECDIFARSRLSRDGAEAYETYAAQVIPKTYAEIAEIARSYSAATIAAPISLVLTSFSPAFCW